MRNMRAVYALRRAMSAVCAVACSSRRITSTCAARSTTATEVLKPFDLHSAWAASAIVFAMPSERLRCMTTPCACAWLGAMTATATASSVERYDMRPPCGQRAGSRDPGSVRCADTNPICEFADLRVDELSARAVAAAGAEQAVHLRHRDAAADAREGALRRNLFRRDEKTGPRGAGERAADADATDAEIGKLRHGQVVAARTRSTASLSSWSGSAFLPVESSIDRPATPVVAAFATLTPTLSASAAKPSSKSALTGTSTHPAIVRRCASATSIEMSLSRRPSDHAIPALVVAIAGKPRPASMRALPMSQGFGITKQPDWCRR